MSYDPGDEPTLPSQRQFSSPYDPTQPFSGQPHAPAEPTLYSPGIAPPPPLPPRKPSRRWLWITLVICVLVLAGVATTTIIVLRTNAARAVSTVVADYYSAVGQQEYVRAYTYVDHQSFTFNGQGVFSQPAYTQVARTANLRLGKLTAYTITNVIITQGTATVIVDRTRGGEVREVIIHLRQVGSIWKIDALVGV
jgi:hypothetical protein